jgi:hypothetical protein
MNQYLMDTEYAAKALFDAINHERDLLAELVKQRDAARAMENEHYTAFLARARQPFAHYWYNELKRAGKEKSAAEEKVAELELRIADREFSIGTLAGAVLQIAKQGLSIVWGKPDDWPKAREVFGQQIGTVIRAARNQALHFEEAAKEDTAKVLIGLAAAGADAQLKDATEKINLASVVLEVLGWKDYESYLKDMTVLLP